MPPPSLADMHTLYSKTRVPHNTFCRFGFTAYRHGGRWFQTAVSFSIEKLIVEQCTRTYTAQPHRQKRHGCRWFHVEARFALIANLAVKIGQGCPIFTGDKPAESQHCRCSSRGGSCPVCRRRSSPRYRSSYRRERRGERQTRHPAGQLQVRRIYKHRRLL